MIRRLLCGVLVVGALAGCRPNIVVEPGAVVVEVERRGPRVGGDANLVAALTGRVVPGEALLRAASCENAVRWVRDVSLNTSLVVGTRPRLVRVAELVATGAVDAGLVAVAEDAWWNGGDVSDAVLGAGFSVDELAEFESLVSEPPSVEALDRFVVYAVSETLWRQAVVYLDVENLQISSVKAFSGRAPTLEVAVAGSDPYGFPTKECVTEDNPDGSARPTLGG